MIRIAVAEMSVLNLLDNRKGLKPNLTAKLNTARELPLSKLRNVRFIRPVTLLRVGYGESQVERILVGKFVFAREEITVRTEYVIAPLADRVSLSPGDFDLTPWKDAQKLEGNWGITLLVADFPKPVYEQEVNKLKLLSILPYVAVQNADMSWTVAGEVSVGDLSPTGEFTSYREAMDAVNSDESFTLGDI